MASSFPMKKNTAVTIVFPILDADGDLVGGAAGLDSEVSIDGAAFSDCTNEAADITSAAANTGLYSLALTAGEMNGDVICIQVKTSTAGAKTTVLVFYTAARTIDDLAFPTTSGRSLDVAATGEAGMDLDNVKQATGATTLSNITIPTVTAVTNDVGVTQGGADKVWLSAARTLTSFGTLVADIWASASRTLTSLGSTIIDAIADQVWDEAIAGHLAAGSTGAALNGASAPSAAAVADAVWDETLSGHLTASTSGRKLSDMPLARFELGK